ncbi:MULTISPECIES: McrC family protein [Flavobacterium]|uniref:McrC family protein n=1 Tax=Flavobacterium TaxID=237 RepID=UPI001181EAEA|nr:MULTISPECIES: restriction endonuclease [Flavobacterium]MCR4029817.1 McrC family protein [Flavobacterium panacis]
MTNNKTIQVFEHRQLKIDDVYNGNLFKRKHYEALSKLNILHNNKYFETQHDGIKFKQYVGVIQVAGLTIEILPKIDNHNGNEAIWQKVLIEMLRVTKKIKIQKVGEANVTRQNRYLLDLYFEWFLNEIQELLNKGLIKQYYKETNNIKALKGKLEFAGHISKNLVHKERFYTTHQIYDKDHLIHQIIAKALEIVKNCSKGTYLHHRTKTLLLDFPEVKNISVTEATFSKISENRKNIPYKTALAICKFIILNFAPNISSGSENMLALLFDMNLLWEEYILVRLKQSDSQLPVYSQQSIGFWNGISIKPDIVIENGTQKYIIDTKWKNISYNKPSTHDLRQMYVYNDYWNSTKAMLLYPSIKTDFNGFIKFENCHRHTVDNNKIEQHECGLGKLSIFKDNGLELNDEIGNQIIRWFK